MLKIKSLLISIVVMSVVSVLALLLLSVFTYVFKWQADTALLGITFTYIFAGYCGGVGMKRVQLRQEKKKDAEVQQKQVNMGKKMLEGILCGTLYMAVLLLVSVIMLQKDMAMEGRFLMIWMLLVGSACLGRIL